MTNSAVYDACALVAIFRPRCRSVDTSEFGKAEESGSPSKYQLRKCSLPSPFVSRLEHPQKPDEPP